MAGRDISFSQTVKKHKCDDAAVRVLIRAAADYHFQKEFCSCACTCASSCAIFSTVREEAFYSDILWRQAPLNFYKKGLEEAAVVSNIIGGSLGLGLWIYG